MYYILNDLILSLCIHLTNTNIIQAYSTAYIRKELIVHRYIHQHTYGAAYNDRNTTTTHCQYVPWLHMYIEEQDILKMGFIGNE